MKYLRFWPLFTVGVLMALLLAFLYIRYSTPIYSAKGSLYINKENSGGGRESLEEMFMFSGSMLNLSNEQQVLKSRPFLRRVVEELNLELSYLNKGKVRSSNIYGNSPIRLEILSLKDSSSSFMLELQTSESTFTLKDQALSIPYSGVFETVAGLFRLHLNPRPSLSSFESDDYIISYQPAKSRAGSLAAGLTIKQAVDQATILEMEYQSDNVRLCQDVVNQIIAEYAAMNIEEKREISQATINFIDDRLDTLKYELGDVETGLQQFREKNDVIDLSSQSQLYYGGLSEANTQLNSLQVQTGVLDYLLGYIGNPDNQFKIVPVDLGIQEPTLLPLFTQYNTLQLQRNEFAETVGEANHTITATNSKLNQIRAQIVEALRNVKQANSITIAKIQDQVRVQQSNIRSVPAKAKNLLDIERQQKIKQDLYLFLLQKREEAAISAAATVASSRPLEEALGSFNPIKPNTKNIYLVALLGGLLVPVAFIFIGELLNDKVLERDEVVRNVTAPLIGEIGHAGEDTLVVVSGSRTVVAEQFRIMRTNVQYMVNKVDKPVVMVTSSVSGEGKSFVATNYGAALALTGKKTVVLEFDIRRPRLLKGLKMTAGKGLSNYIIGQANLEDIILSVPEINNLYVIGCGPIPPNPAELLLDEKVAELFSLLKQQFDNIVIDTAPVGLVSDAFTLSSYADAGLYIIRQGYTLKRQLNMVEELYQKKRLPNMGVVVNDIKTQGRYKGYYGYGGGNYYGYSGYGDGGEYFDTTKK